MSMLTAPVEQNRMNHWELHVFCLGEASEDSVLSHPLFIVLAIGEPKRTGDTSLAGEQCTPVPARMPKSDTRREERRRTDQALPLLEVGAGAESFPCAGQHNRTAAAAAFRQRLKAVLELDGNLGREGVVHVRAVDGQAEYTRRGLLHCDEFEVRPGQSVRMPAASTARPSLTTGLSQQ